LFAPITVCVGEAEGAGLEAQALALRGPAGQRATRPLLLFVSMKKGPLAGRTRESGASGQPPMYFVAISQRR